MAEAVREGISPVKTDSPQRPGASTVSPIAYQDLLPLDSFHTPTKKRNANIESAEVTMDYAEVIFIHYKLASQFSAAT